ncbi:MAG TPA: hypothetical protein VJU16_06710 [Planctomycetota bacterium]|nr:hypothetical protein [Planctomycetota bacterium]
MALVLPDAGERNALDMWLSDASPEAQTLKLYTNDVTPAEGDTAATYTEAAGSGYASKALARATWNAAATNAGVTSKDYPQQTFNWTGTITIVGYFIVKVTAGTILWAERMFTSPGQVFNNGDVLKVTPRIEQA